MTPLYRSELVELYLGDAAILLGRRAVLVELDQHHAATAVRRLRHAEELRAQMVRA